MKRGTGTKGAARAQTTGAGAESNDVRILGVLRTAKAPMSAYAILDAVRSPKIAAPMTVYRALSRLVERGQVHRLESINAYVACRQQCHDQGQTVFAICNACGGVDELVEAGLLEHFQANALQRGFQVDVATIELSGRCAACAGP